MKKKITTMLLLSLLLLIGKTDAATLTQKIGNGYISSNISAGKQVTMNFVSQANFTFTSWTVESGNVTIDTTRPTVTFTMPSSDVTIRANYTTASAGGTGGTGGGATPTTYTCACSGCSNTVTTSGTWCNTCTAVGICTGCSKCVTHNTALCGTCNLCSSCCICTRLANYVNVGDYITYVPNRTTYTVPSSASGYTSNQTFNPSNTTSWKVFSNDGTNVEIISSDSVGRLYLSGTVGYANAVQTLNGISKAYVNYTYAVSGRSLGYYDEMIVASDGTLGIDMTETQKANYKMIDPAVHPFGSMPNAFPSTDYQYYPDMNVVANNTSLQHDYNTDYYIWIASRTKTGDYNYGSLGFMVRQMSYNSSCNSTGGGFWYKDDGSRPVNSSSGGVRPIIKLKSGAKITGGSGTQEDPYIITAPESTSPQTYTLTYVAKNGSSVPSSQTGTELIISSTVPTRSGCVFAGWGTSSDSVIASYQPDDSIILTADTTLYAVWKEAYTITYNANGGSGSMSPQSIATGLAIRLDSNSFSYSGMSFLGWSTSQWGSVVYLDGETVIPTANMTLYAQWEVYHSCWDDYTIVRYEEDGNSTHYSVCCCNGCGSENYRSDSHIYDSATFTCTLCNWSCTHGWWLQYECGYCGAPRT